jgi:hypothetical protein
MVNICLSIKLLYRWAQVKLVWPWFVLPFSSHDVACYDWHMHTRTHTCTHIHTRTHTARARAHTHTHTHACTHIHTRMYTHRHAHTHTHVHTQTRTYTHACTHTDTRTPAPPFAGPKGSSAAAPLEAAIRVSDESREYEYGQGAGTCPAYGDLTARLTAAIAGAVRRGAVVARCR